MASVPSWKLPGALPFVSLEFCFFAHEIQSQKDTYSSLHGHIQHLPHCSPQVRLALHLALDPGFASHLCFARVASWPCPAESPRSCTSWEHQSWEAKLLAC